MMTWAFSQFPFEICLEMARPVPQLGSFQRSGLEENVFFFAETIPTINTTA